jgi:hypothetical protein
MGLGLAGLMATVALAVGGAHGAASARPIVFGTEASNKHLAEVQAERELRSIKLPPGARRVDSSPAPVLDEWVESRGGYYNSVARSKWLVAPGSVAGTLGWFLAHPPANSHTDGREGGVRGRRTAVALWFEVLERSRRVYGPSVVPAVTALSHHRVGIRLEVQQVWKTPHPAAAKVPAAARLLYVSGAGGGVKPLRHVIRSPRRVRRIARVIDRLPATQPQFISCPEESGGRPPELKMKFKAREGGPVLAEASQHVPLGCGESMSLSVRGNSRTFGLDYGERAIELLHR